MAMIVLAVLVLVTIGIALIPGLGLFAVIPAFLALLYGGWLALAVATGRTPGATIRRAGRRDTELLGPGGPDDPQAP
jgi:hypothetical protein